MAWFTTQALLVRCLLGGFLSPALWAALFSFVQAEYVELFDSHITIEPDGTLVVEETIVYDFESTNRHGIYRSVEPYHAQSASTWYKDRYIDIELLSVRRDNQPELYQVEGEDGLFVRIGDANKTISGVHRYEIVYRVSGALSVYDDLTELYWNVTGDGWSVPMRVVTARLTAVDGVGLQEDLACYVGRVGDTTACDSAQTAGDQSVHFTATNMAAGEQLTIAEALTLPESPVILERINWLWLLLPLCVLISIGWGAYLYHWRTEHRGSTTVVAQYEPYYGFKPMFTGVLIDNRLDAKDITAGIIYLAAQGFISVKQTTKKILFFDVHDYELTLLRPLTEVETHFQKTLLRLIFESEHGLMTGFGNVIGGLLSQSAPKDDVMYPGLQVRLSAIKKNQAKLKANAKLIEALKKSVEADLLERDFIEQRMSRTVAGGVMVVAFIVLLVSFYLLFIIGPFAVLFSTLAAAAIAHCIFGVERRTAKGYEAYHYLLGFKTFLSMTDKERYAFHNAPDKKPEHFMEYLPFAIAFGVEEEWAEVFKDIQLVPPSWYQSDVSTSFSAAAFSSEMSSFGTAFSGSTGTGGSSGGGSAGGGSGGGGGGSW